MNMPTHATVESVFWMRKYMLSVCLVLLLTLHPTAMCAQAKVEKMQWFRVMFYNVENLFDTEDNPHANDNEFLPEGLRRWTPGRYIHHLRQTARVITAAGQWETPALVGMCEVENDSVVIHLLRRTPLRTQGFRYCMTRSNDPRGINNVLLYRPDKFRYLGHESRRIRFTNSRRRSRDILHVWGQVITGDTLDVFVCHFPSRIGGERTTEQSRMDAAIHVRRACDSLCRLRRRPNLVIMGDFNDTPANKSIRALTQAAQSDCKLANLFADPRLLNAEGSHKYRGVWAQLDHIMVSRAWKAFLKEGSPQIFNPSFLLTEDKTKRGQRPKRTYNGARYEGGFSDHLPVLADFLLPIPE
jgi:endonuclease/exonuclease/phosphatase family metal-dependent hydrolase